MSFEVHAPPLYDSWPLIRPGLPAQGSLFLFPTRQGSPSVTSTSCRLRHPIYRCNLRNNRPRPAFKLASALPSAPGLTPTPPGEIVHLSPNPFDDRYITIHDQRVLYCIIEPFLSLFFVLLSCFGSSSLRFVSLTSLRIGNSHIELDAKLGALNTSITAHRVASHHTVSCRIESRPTHCAVLHFASTVIPTCQFELFLPKLRRHSQARAVVTFNFSSQPPWLPTAPLDNICP